MSGAPLQDKAETERLNAFMTSSEVHAKALEDRFERIHRQRLRDQFAMAALTGLLANDSQGAGLAGYRFDLRAESAYKMADAMLVARDARETQP